jgi:hypothetical protein
MYSLRELSRRWGVATLAPIKFARETGHFRSSILGKAETAEGQPLPWFTFPAIAFLETLDVSDLNVLEWGSGHSTLWWASRAATVLSIEHDQSWYDRVRRDLKHMTTVELRLVRDDEAYVRSPTGRQVDLW